MECPDCGYILSPLEQSCPRCANSKRNFGDNVNPTIAVGQDQGRKNRRLFVSICCGLISVSVIAFVFYKIGSNADAIHVSSNQDDKSQVDTARDLPSDSNHSPPQGSASQQEPAGRMYSSDSSTQPQTQTAPIGSSDQSPRATGQASDTQRTDASNRGQTTVDVRIVHLDVPNISIRADSFSRQSPGLLFSTEFMVGVTVRNNGGTSIDAYELPTLRLTFDNGMQESVTASGWNGTRLSILKKGEWYIGAGETLEMTFWGYASNMLPGSSTLSTIRTGFSSSYPELRLP